MSTCSQCFFFFFNDTATTEIYTLSLHDALPICNTVIGMHQMAPPNFQVVYIPLVKAQLFRPTVDRKSTRLNSSHQIISYAVFCLKKKKRNKPHTRGEGVVGVKITGGQEAAETTA